MRLNQFLARSGLAARRKADQLILAGQVKVNGQPAIRGQQVDPSADRVTVQGRLIRLPESHTYLVMNKPAGVLTTASDDRGRETVIDRLGPRPDRVFPVGRLDRDSRGLLILTSDGDLAMRLMHPRYHVEKEYRVLISGRPGADALRRLRGGMIIGHERFAPARVKVIHPDALQTLVSMVLAEGRKREVRRLWRALGHEVLDLERVRIGPLQLGRLATGTVRPLTTKEVASLRAAVHLPRAAPGGGSP